MNKTIILLAIAGLLASGNVWAAQTEASYAHIPTTVSEEAAAIIRMLPDPSLKPVSPAHDDIKAWTAIQREMETHSLERSKPIVKKLESFVTEMELGGDENRVWDDSSPCQRRCISSLRSRSSSSEPWSVMRPSFRTIT